MPLIPRTGRRHWKVRLLFGLLYLLLAAGALTMLYPFGLMVAGSAKSAVDVRENTLVPGFLRDRDRLYRKHIEGLLNESLDTLRMTYDVAAVSFADLAPPKDPPPGLVRLWREFLAAGRLPSYAVGGGYLRADYSRTVPAGLRGFKRELQAEFAGDVRAANRALGTDFVSWNTWLLDPENYLLRGVAPVPTPLHQRLQAFKARQPDGLRYVPTLAGFYRRIFLPAQYGRDIADYNRAQGTAFRDYGEVPLPRRAPPAGDPARRDWEILVRETLNAIWLVPAAAANPAYRAYLVARYPDVATLNAAYGTDYRRFDDCAVPAAPLVAGTALTDWHTFLAGWTDPATGRHHAPELEQLALTGPEFLFQDFLAARYGDVAALNRDLDTRYADFAAIAPPQAAQHYLYFCEQVRALRTEFLTRNFKTVLDYLWLHGRGLTNTLVYCLLAVLAALVVNPLAAYALSRFRLAATYQILLFLLLTMAFPPMVTQIPNFVLLRELGLLNTFAALVLPGMAHGYSIFLLKGFFDSLPRDLYESAQMDGASEWTIFRQVTLALSKPILAVIALQAFTLAYSNFMFALLICQDERMWTLMVWLYQLQERSGQGVIYASLLIAAVPTLIVFSLCQKVILRGIVVPVEK